MGSSKLGKFIIFGALTGAVISMFDRSTRDHMAKKSKAAASEIRFYSKNPDVLKWKMQEKKEKLETVYEQLSGDVLYIKEQVEELKTLTPQVKELMINTKDAFVESKDEYKSMVSEMSAQEDTDLKK